MKIVVISSIEPRISKAPIGDQIKELDHIIGSVNALKENGVILDCYGVPGEDKIISVVEVESIYHAEELFDGLFKIENGSNRLFYVSDFVKALEDKKDRLSNQIESVVH